MDAAVWLEPIRINPHITETLHECRRLPEPDSGSTYALLAWTLLPPPPAETPAIR